MLQQQVQELQQFIQSGQLEKTQSETQKNLATAAKTMKDANVSEAQLSKIHAESIRTLEEAKRTASEVNLAQNQQGNERINVNL